MQKSPRLLLALAFLSSWSLATRAVCQTIPSPSDGPLIVNAGSHIVLMEYEAWFGPKAVTFQSAAAQPLLQSSDMQAAGGGYDSADPAVIQNHVAHMEALGVDAAIADLTNNVSCIFDSEWFVRHYVRNCPPSFRKYNQTIRDNTGNLFPAWTSLGTHLKLIPLLGGIDDNVMNKDLDGKTALEKEIEYFGALMRQYPQRQVIYEGKPLMLIFLGAAQDPNRADHPLWVRIRELLNDHPEYGGKYTFRLMAGYLDSQPGLWLHQGVPDGPIEVNPEYGFWSWVDRSNPSCTVQPFVLIILLITSPGIGQRTSPHPLPPRDRMAGVVRTPKRHLIVPTMPCALERTILMRPSTPSWRSRASYSRFS